MLYIIKLVFEMVNAKFFRSVDGNALMQKKDTKNNMMCEQGLILLPHPTLNWGIGPGGEVMDTFPCYGSGV